MNKIFNYCEKNKIVRFIFDFLLGLILFIVVGGLIVVAMYFALMYRGIVIISSLVLFSLWMIYGFGMVARALILDKVYPDEKLEDNNAE